MNDDFEAARRARLAEINAAPRTRIELEAAYGAVWDTAELTLAFEVVGFVAPFAVVRRRTDGVVGSVEFQHAPRLFFNFEPDEPRNWQSCGFCHTLTPLADRLCRTCGHEAHAPRLDCRCPVCVASGQGPAPTEKDVQAVLDRLLGRRRPDPD